MTIRVTGILIPLLLAACAAGGADESGAYFAPENIFFSKLVRGDGRIVEFVRDATVPSLAVSLDGWVAEARNDGSVDVRSSADPARSKHRYLFRNGRALSYSRKGQVQTYGADAARRLPPAIVPPLEQSLCEIAGSDHVKNEMASKWKGTGRLQWPYQNPNFSGALFAELALLAFGVALLLRGRFARVALLSVAAASLVCMLWTGSRGAMLGFALGGLVFAAVFRRRLVASRRLTVGIVAGIVLVAVALAVFKSDIFLRGFSSESRWSNSLRMDMWKAAPTMIADAPEGWFFCRPGAAYFDWYQPIESMSLTGSLMNDHLGVLVASGTLARFGYLFAWALVLFWGVRHAFRDRRPAALAIVLAFAGMAWFNPIFVEKTLWIVPALAVCELALTLPWRKVRLHVSFVLAAVASSVVLLGGIIVLARIDPFGQKSIVRAVGNRVLVNGSEPDVWVVNDERDALGGLMSCKGIRAFYRRLPRASAIGYVSAVSDIPVRVGRLVLAGRAGMEWLVALGENPELRTHLPREVIFISPSFTPSQVPEGVLKACRVRMLVGEFAAAYQPEFGKGVPDWVTVVPGMELYIASWMSMIVGG